MISEFNKPKDFSDLTVGDVIHGYDKYLVMYNEEGIKLQISPIHHAFMFYYVDHFLMDVDNKFGNSIPEYVIEYVKVSLRIRYIVGIHMFYYLLMICHREVRYVHSGGSYTKFFEKEENKEYKEYFDNFRGSSSYDALTTLTKHSNEFLMIDFVRVIMDLFYKGSFSSAYGGKNWGNIAKVLYKFLIGEYSLFVMTDMAFALEHNTGNIFNKGVFYESMYSSVMTQVLDCQRAGVIPQYFNNFVAYNDKVIQEFKDNFSDKVSEIFPSYKDAVDWGAVNEAGSVGTYKNNSEGVTETNVSGNYLTLFPGCKIESYERKGCVLGEYI